MQLRAIVYLLGVTKETADINHRTNKIFQAAGGLR